MLPKRPAKKNQKDTQQLKLEESISFKQKAKRKRTFLLVVLGLTVGLSIVFSFYRFTLNVSSRLHFSLPRIKINLPLSQKTSKINLDKIIKPLLPSHDSWSIYVKTLQNPPFSWSLNFPNPTPDSIINSLAHQQDSTDSLSDDFLPQGVKIKEKIIKENNLYEYQTIISVPRQQIFIFIKTSDQHQPSHLIPSLIQAIYWTVIKI